MRKLDNDDPLTMRAAEIYRGGATLQEAADAVFISREALRDRFEKAGIPRRDIRNRKLKPKKIEELRKDRAAGLKCTAIAEKHGVSLAAVSHYTKDIAKEKRENKRQRVKNGGAVV